MTRVRAPQSLAAIIDGFIDPRPAEYRGVRMRSQLEADFAAHLDRQRADWQYEPAVYGKSGSGYLPDFEITGAAAPTFIEVKPTLSEVTEAKRRMEVIWDAVPHAVLVVACAEGSTFFAAVRGEAWTSWVELWPHA